MLWLYGPAAFGGHFLTDGGASEDVVHLSILYELFADHMRGGEIAWWMPEFACGYPAFASWMYGLLYPGLALYLVFSPETAWAWTAILHTAFGAAGMVALARTAGCKNSGAVAAGLLFGLAEFVVVRSVVGHLNITLPATWAPWVLHFLIGTVQGRARALPLLCLTGALGLLSGHVQVWFYFSVGAAVVAVFSTTRAECVPAMLRVGCAALIVLALTAIQWIPSVLLLSVSDGGVTDLDLRQQGSLSLHAGAERFVPGVLGRFGNTFPWGDYGAGEDLYHEMIGMSGVWLLIPAIFAARLRSAVPWITIVVVAAFISGGDGNVVGRLFHELPGFETARAPARAQILIVLCGPVVVGLGIDQWMARRDGMRLVIGAVVVCALIVASAVIAGRVEGVGPAQVRPAVLVAILTTAAVAGVFVFSADRPRRGLIPAAVLAAAAFVVALPPVHSVSSRVYRMAWEDAVPEDLRSHRIHLDGNMFPPIERRGMRSTRELSHVDVAGYRALAHSRGGPGVGYWLDVGVAAHRGWESVVFDVPEGAGPADLLLLKRLGAIGDGALFADAGQAADLTDSEVADRLADGDRSAYVRTGGELRRHPPLAVPARGRVSREEAGSPNQRRFVVEAPAAALVVTSDKWSPGWTAALDGEAVEIHAAQMAFAAIRVPAGPHVITMSYRAPGLLAGAWTTLAGLLGLLFVGFRSRMQMRTTPR